MGCLSQVPIFLKGIPLIPLYILQGFLSVFFKVFDNFMHVYIFNQIKHQLSSYRQPTPFIFFKNIKHLIFYIYLIYMGVCLHVWLCVPGTCADQREP